MYCDISSNSTLQIKFFAKYGDTTKVELALWHNFTNSTIETWQNAPIVLTDNVGNILYSTTLPSTLEYWNDKRQIFEHTIKDDEFNKTNPSNLGDVSHSTIETNKVVFLGEKIFPSIDGEFSFDVDMLEGEMKNIFLLHITLINLLTRKI